MITEYTVYHPSGRIEHGSVDWPEQPGWDLMRPFFAQFIKGWPEHVNVLFNTEARDMFVDDESALIGLPWNEAASKIYQAASVRRGMKEEDLPSIYGPAVLFPNRRVWF